MMGSTTTPLQQKQHDIDSEITSVLQAKLSRRENSSLKEDKCTLNNGILLKSPYTSISTGKEEIENIDGITIVSFETESDMLEFTNLECEYIKNLMKNNRNRRGRRKTSKKYENLNESIVPTKTNDITKIKGWKTKVFSSNLLEDTLQSVDDVKVEGKKAKSNADFYVDISDSSEDMRLKEENISCSSDFFGENLEETQNKLNFIGENKYKWDFTFEDIEPLEYDINLSKSVKKEDMKNGEIVKQNGVSFNSDLSSVDLERSCDNDFRIQEVSLCSNVSEKFELKELEVTEEQIYSSESEDGECMEVSDVSCALSSFKDKFKSTESIMENSSCSSSILIHTFDSSESRDGSELNEISKNDEFTKCDINDDNVISDNSCNSVLSLSSSESLYEELVFGEKTSGKLIHFMEDLDSSMDLSLNDDSTLKELENKTLDNVLNKVHSELLYNDKFIKNHKTYITEKINETEGLLESSTLECYLKKFSKLQYNPDIYTETIFTSKEAKEFVNNFSLLNNEDIIPKVNLVTTSKKTSIGTNNNVDSESYPKGFILVYGRPFMIDNKELIPRRKNKASECRNDKHNVISDDIGITQQKDEEDDYLSDNSCKMIINDHYIGVSLDNKDELNVQNIKEIGESVVNKKVLTDERLRRNAFFRKYKKQFPFILSCKSETYNHSNCSFFSNVSLGMVITVGNGRPMAREVSENVNLLKLNESVIDSRWAHIAASAVIDPKNKECKDMKRLLVPVVEKVLIQLINREDWFDCIPESVKESNTLANVFVWCHYHSCYNCSCSTPVLFLKANELIWKPPYGGYCMNEKELSDIELKTEPFGNFHLYDIEKHTARSVGVLLNYSRRNKDPSFVSKRLFEKHFPQTTLTSNSYVRLKLKELNLYIENENKKEVEIEESQIIISDDELSVGNLVEEVTENIESEFETKGKVCYEFDPTCNTLRVDVPTTQMFKSNKFRRIICNSVDLPKKERRKYSIGPAHFERKGGFRTLVCTNNMNQEQEIEDVSNKTKQESIVTETGSDIPLTHTHFKSDEKVNNDLPEYGLLCPTTEFGYLAVDVFSQDKVSIEDPLDPKLYHCFKNLELANIWLNKVFKGYMTFESQDTDLRWIIAKRGLLRASKPFDKSILFNESIMISKERKLVKKPTHSDLNGGIKTNVENENSSSLKRNLENIDVSKSQIKKIRISDIVKQMEGKEKLNSENFQKIDKLANLQSSSNIFSTMNLNVSSGPLTKSSNLFKINISGFKGRRILGTENQIKNSNGIIPNILRKNNPSVMDRNGEDCGVKSTIIMSKDNKHLTNVSSLMNPFTNRMQRNSQTVTINKSDIRRLSVLKKSFPIIVPSNSKVLLRNKSPDCILVSQTNKTLPLNIIKSTPAKSILKTNLK